MSFASELAGLMKRFNTIVMIGSPACGKTFISTELGKLFPEFRVIHTDDYIAAHGFVDGLYILMEELKALPADTKLLIEGVMCCRLLRKGVQTNSFFPDCVIEIQAEANTIARVCFERGKDYDKIVAMEKGSQTILAEYKDTLAHLYNKDNTTKIPLFVGLRNIY